MILTSYLYQKISPNFHNVIEKSTEKIISLLKLDEFSKWHFSVHECVEMVVFRYFCIQQGKSSHIYGRGLQLLQKVSQLLLLQLQNEFRRGLGSSFIKP
jgi:hypothetical protein